MRGALAFGLVPAAPLRAVVDPYPRRGLGLKVGLAAYSFRKHFEWMRGKRNEAYQEGDRAMDMLKFIHYCADQGAQGAELTSYFFAPDAGEAEFRACRRVAEERGIAISGTAVGNNFSHAPSSLERAEQIAYVQQWIENAALMGAPHVRVFAGHYPKEVSPDEAVARAISALNEAAVLAGERQIYLGIENHDSIATAERLLRIVRAVDSPWVGVNLDSGNFIAEDVYAEIAATAPFAVNVQVKTEIRTGADGKGRAPADLERVVKILKDSGYEGFVTLEFEEDTDPYEHVPPLLEKLRKWCA